MDSRTVRKESYGQSGKLTLVDRFGCWLSGRQIRRWISRFDGLRVGDFGCGFHAKFARSFVDAVEELVLVDVALADDLVCHSKVNAVIGQLPAALNEIPDSSLDVVMCTSVLEHLWEPQVALKEMYRVLKVDGWCLVNVPSWRGKVFLEYSAFRLGFSPAAEMDDHKRYYDPRDLWPMLVAAGYRPSRIHCFRHKFGLNTFAACRKG